MVKLSLDGSAKMLATLGTQDFGRSLMAAAHELIAADYCSLFMFDAGGSPVCLATNGIKSDRLAIYAADRYAKKHWRTDPTLLELKGRRSSDALLIAGLSREYSSGAYRRDCVDALQIGDRMTFLFGDDRRFLRLSFYRYAVNRAFGEAERAIAWDSAEFFRCATTRHRSLTSQAGIDHLEAVTSCRAMRARLLALHPGLSPREVEVCALILQGLSTDVIALQIGIGKTSVITYRKRAYAKLGISTQSQLFAACLGGAVRCDRAC